MKIAIVGAGFYGSYLAYKLKENHEIIVFESNSDIMMKSAMINQCRLHQGYHYPRSPETMLQTGQGYFDFLKEFERFTKIIPNNIYAIKDNGLNTLDLLQKGLHKDIFVTKCNAPIILRDTETYTNFLRVNERLILLDKLKEYLKGEIKDHVEFNCEVLEINPTGILKTQDTSQSFDFIINTTYVNPNMGLEKNLFIFSYELAAMLCLKIPSLNDFAITIIDGEYISLYPNYKGEYTLSSVTYTPFYKTSDRSEFQSALKNANKIAKNSQVEKNILNHGQDFLDLPPFEVCDLWISPKVKLLPNINDYRGGILKREGKTISTFCGKLDSVFCVYSDILNIIGD